MLDISARFCPCYPRGITPPEIIENIISKHRTGNENIRCTPYANFTSLQ